MKALPTLPQSCSLDAPGAAAQAERYRRAGATAELIESAPQLLTVRIGEEVPAAEIEELIAVERECCPFFEIDWRPAERLLAIGVGREQDGPALDAIAYALGLEAARRPVEIGD
jgi:hypothetical protein